MMKCTWTEAGKQAEPLTGGLAPMVNLAASHDGFSTGGTFLLASLPQTPISKLSPLL